jgi:hypothetical protein
LSVLQTRDSIRVWMKETQDVRGPAQVDLQVARRQNVESGSGIIYALFLPLDILAERECEKMSFISFNSDDAEEN